MDNNSLYEITEQIASLLSPLGLHAEGPPTIQGLLADGADDEEEAPEDFDIDFLTDKLKSDEAMAVIHMTFGINKLAWSDRILRPQVTLSPDVIDELDFNRNAFMKEQIKIRLEDGEELDDILADLMKGDQ
jgi:hypothetical protein